MMFDSTFGKLLTERVAPTIPVNNANTSGLKLDSESNTNNNSDNNNNNGNNNPTNDVNNKSEISEAEVRLVVRFVVEEHIVYNGKIEEVTQLDCEEVSRIVSRIAWDGAKYRYKETKTRIENENENENIADVESNTQNNIESSKSLETNQRTISSPVSSRLGDKQLEENNELVQMELGKHMLDKPLDDHNIDVNMVDVEKESTTSEGATIAQHNNDNDEDITKQIDDNETNRKCDIRTTTEQTPTIVCETTSQRKDDSIQIQEKSGVQDAEVKIEHQIQSPTNSYNSTSSRDNTITITSPATSPATSPTTPPTTTPTITTSTNNSTTTTTTTTSNTDLDKCPQNSRPTLSTSNSNNMIGQLTRQSKVFARWSDNHFYPGTILRPNKDRKFVIGFFDGAQRTVAETDLIPLCNIGGKQVRVTIAKNYCVNAIVHDHLLINEKPMFEVEYQQDGLVRKCVPLKDIFLTAEQGTPLIDQPIKPDKNPDESMFAGVDLDNIVHVKRSRRLQEMEDMETKSNLSGTPLPPPQSNRRKRGQYNMRHTTSRAKPTSGTYNSENTAERSHRRYTYSNGGQDTPASSCSPVDIKSNPNGPNSNPPSESSNSTEHSNVTEMGQEFYFNSSSSPHPTETSPLS